MLMRLHNWYKNLTPLQQLGILFIINWIIWFIGSLIEESVFYNEEHSWIYHIFNATWMAFFMTIPFNWKKVKFLFKKQPDRNTIDANE